MRRRVRQSRCLAPVAVLLLAACEPAPQLQPTVTSAQVERGREAIDRVGCASCHSISGIAWPKGAAAPAIGRMADRALIAGRLPNRPDVLARFVRNAPAELPGTTMPAMPLSEQESRDVAAYLYAIEAQ